MIVFVSNYVSLSLSVKDQFLNNYVCLSLSVKDYFVNTFVPLSLSVKDQFSKTYPSIMPYFIHLCTDVSRSLKRFIPKFIASKFSMHMT
jgi:hypothetical protein